MEQVYKDEFMATSDLTLNITKIRHHKRDQIFMDVRYKVERSLCHVNCKFMCLVKL
jgi:hypothetical protein